MAVGIMQPAVQSVAPAWNAGVALALALVFSLLAAWPSVRSLEETWRTVHDYQFGYLIAAVSGAWFARAAWSLRHEGARPSPAGTALLIASLAAWLVVFRANSLMAHQLMLPIVLWSACLALGGWRAARAVAAPVTYLYFAIPIWDSLLPFLQQLSVGAVGLILWLLGVPAEISEFTVTLPAGSFEIIEGCSGKRYFMVTLALAVLAGAVHRLRGWRYAGYVALAGLLALIANWIRIVIVIYAGHASGMQHYLVAVEHRTLGHVIFGLLILAVFLLASRFASPRAVAVDPRRADPTVLIDGKRHVWPAALAIVALGTVSMKGFAYARVAPDDSALGAWPVSTEAWQGPLPARPAWSPHYVGPSSERRAAYQSAAGTVEVYVNLYGWQRQGRELVQYSNSLTAPGAWTREWPLVNHAIDGGAWPLEALEATSADGSRWLVAHGYRVGPWSMTSDAAAQLAYGLRSIGGETPSGVIAVAARCGENCKAAQALVTTFWDDMSEPIQGMLPDEGPGR